MGGHANPQGFVILFFVFTRSGRQNTSGVQAMQENVTFRVLVQHQSIKCNDFGSQLIGVQNVDERTQIYSGDEQF